MIIGTAGHVDHGKTSLVKALTGVDTDRLAEEKRRGITLELGFASLRLPDGSQAGVVDVPGHERFVKAMASGAGGVDLAILVVAADEGVMPQTREHLDICRLLGVRRGVIALTKADLLPALGPGWQSLVEADLRALVEGTFLEGAPILTCSARTGEGLPALVSALGAAAEALPVRPAEGPLFLPVDRAFSLKGFGTVVTGTLLSGQLAVEERVSLLPGRVGPLRVRGLQVHGAPVAQSQAGTRTAVNLAGVEAEALSRGQVLTRFEELPEARRLDVELTLLPAAERPLPRRSKLLLHLGTAQVECTVALLELPALAPGETGLAQLGLGAPVAALVEQRFLLRGSKALPGRGATLAGGRVLSLDPPKRRKGTGAHLAVLQGGDLEARLVWLLRQAGYRGLTARELFARAASGQKAVLRALERLSSRGQALLWDRDARRYLSAEVFDGMQARALALLAAFHAREPLKEGISLEELKRRLWAELDPKLYARLTQALIERGKVERVEELLRLAGRGRSLTVAQAGARERLLARLSAAGLGPPTVDALALELGLPAARVVALLNVCAAEGGVVKVSEGLYFDRAAVDGLEARLLSYLRESKEIATQAFKGLVGQSRKFVIPLSEYFDRQKVTLRVGEKRVLRRG